VLFREPADLPDELIFHVSYLGGDMPTFQINFSRPAGQVIAQYFDFIRFGKAGYTAVHGSSHEIAEYCAQKIGTVDGFEIIHDGSPDKGIPAVVWTQAENTEHGFTLYDLADRLRMRGWQVPAYPFTGDLAHKAFQRILVKRGFTREMADLLLIDIEQAIDFLTSHSRNTSPSSAQASSYNHL
jgi:glutamate decarboxylase